MLSDRRQKVLAALIEEYVSSVMPVGSRTLTERYPLGISSATVRNEFSALEEAGYITQPHTSAGRIPTDNGYRSFVDDMLDNERIQEDEATAEAIRSLRATATELDDLLDKTSAALTKLTDCLAIVLPPNVLSLHIRQISLIPLSSSRLVIIVVTEDGRVLNRSLDAPDGLSPADTSSAQNLLNSVLAGKTIAGIRESIDADTMMALRDPFVQAVLSEVLACLQEHEVGHAHRLGLASLMKQPEFNSGQALAPIMQMLEDDAVLLHLLGRGTSDGSSDTVVRIGHENGNEMLAGISVVASRYDFGSSGGIVAVVGPTRMNYQKAIKAVRAAQQALNGR